MLRLALSRVLLVNLNSIRNELNISNKVLVRLSNFTKSNVLALDSGLLGLVCFFIGHLSNLDLSASSNNSMLSRAEIPNNDLSINTSSDDDVIVVGMKFNSSHFNRRFQNIVENNNMAVLEVHNEDVSA
jgi:hypothetical protein